MTAALDALRALADDLARTGREEDNAVDYVKGERGLWADVEPEVRRIIDLLAPRVVTTAAELDALPAGAVVVDPDGAPLQASRLRAVGRVWFRPGVQTWALSLDLATDGPFTVVWSPAVTE